MKRLTIRFFLFSIPIFLFLIILECHLRNRETIFSYKKRHFESVLPLIEGLVLGHSHALAGINPEWFDMPVYNIANSGQSIYYDTEIVLSNLTKMPKLKIVFFPLSYFSLGYELISSGLEWREGFYLTYYHISPESRKYKISDFSFIYRYGFEKSFNTLFSPPKQNISQQISKWGWDQREVHLSNITERKGKERAKFHTSIFHNNSAVKNIKCLENFLHKLNDRDIRCVFLTPPIYQTYSAYLDSTIIAFNLEQINQFCDQFDCDYYDYSTDARFQLEDFSDNDHLNASGANKFSKILAADVLTQYD